LRTGAVRFTFSLDSNDPDSAAARKRAMPTDHIRYDLLAQEALRGVVRRVLSDVARNGLPGEHHFYVTFDTRAPGLKISDRLKAEHPEEMTIVLQHQFWDLAITDEAFEVGLSFKGIPERLVIPIEAIKGFFDPSVQFGLQFETLATTEAEAAPPEAKEAKRRGSAQATAPAAEAKPQLPARPSAEAAEPEPRPPAEGGQVVRLDRFRKK
jgi:uncharacterized protein